MTFVRRALQAGLSRGHGYERHDPGTHSSRDEVKGYFIDYRPKIDAHAARPHEALQPADMAQLALGWWERHLLGDGTAAEEYLQLAARLVNLSEARDGCLFWPYQIDLPKYALTAPWYSGMAQGQVASVFVRAWQLSGDDRDAETARLAVAPLLRPGREALATTTADGPALEECGPCRPPSHILNGWIFALWGVRDTWLALGHTEAGALVEASTDCLARALPRYDTGWWSKYSLYPHPLADLAKPFYHRLHVTQLQILSWLTGRVEFRDTATRWSAYDTRPAVAAALATKLPFRAANAIARRRQSSGLTRG